MAGMPLDPRIHACRDDLAAEHLRGKVRAQRFVAGTPMQVLEGAVALRAAPGTDRPISTEALYGERFTVYEQREGWAWGQLETDGYVGYLPQAALGGAGAAPTHQVAVLRTHIYPVAHIKAPHTVLLSINTPLAVEALEGGFARLADRAGFVFAAHLRAIGDVAPDFVAVAEMFLGTPYLWGGRTSVGLDCSALVQLALQAAGLPCPRDSDLQEAALGSPLAVPLERASLERGDLVFWKGHVGIMSDAGTLLHANGHHMLTVAEPFDEARARIARAGLEVLKVRRLEAGSG